jgi:hypothetical protein
MPINWLDAKPPLRRLPQHPIAGAETMKTTARLSAFLAFVLVGAFVAAYRSHGAAIDAYLHTSHLHVMDWALLLFGSLAVAGITYKLLTQPETFDWRGGVWLIVGAFMIYAALGDNASFKEAACQILNSHHGYKSSSPCYQ